MQEESLAMSPIFIVLTRPVMKLGVTFDYLGLSVLTTLCIVILFNNPFMGIIYLPLHLFGVLVCWQDPFAFQLLLKRINFNFAPNKKRWGCVSYEPY